MPKIVITDSDFVNNDFEFAMARAANVEIAAFQGPKPQDIIRNAADADAIVTSYGTFTPEVFAALPNLQAVSRTGIGYDTIDVPAATKNKTAVCVVPGYGTEVVSDHAITLALCVLRRMNETDADMRAGIWDYARHRPLGQVYGRTFGVVGMGEIGRATARKAAGLGFRVICTSRSLVPGRRTPEGYDIVEYGKLLRRADVVSFHTALTPDTRHMLDAHAISLMKPDAIVVNTARGAVVDTAASPKRSKPVSCGARALTYSKTSRSNATIRCFRRRTPCSRRMRHIGRKNRVKSFAVVPCKPRSTS